MKKGKVIIPDTNVILRYLLNDDKTLFDKANTLFDGVRVGEKRALVLESVLVECVYVLAKYYNVARNEIAGALTALLLYKGIVNADKQELMHSLALYQHNTLDIVDCIIATKGAMDGMAIASFDKKLTKMVTSHR